MFCHNGSLFLEISLGPANVTALMQNSSFCYYTTHFICYTSLPLGVLILTVTVAAVLSLHRTWKEREDGIGVIFMMISISDFINGLFCIEKFIFLIVCFRMRRTVFYHFGSSTFSQLYQWLSWFLIYNSWVLKLFLNLYRIHRYLSNNMDILWYRYSNKPFDKKRGWIIIAVCAVIGLVEMGVIHDVNKVDPWANTTMPFLGLQIFLALVSSAVVISLMLKDTDQDEGWSQRFAAGTIALNCLTSLIINFPMMFGDLSCLFPYEYPTPNWEPACFLPFVKYISYFESLCFSLILFRSKVLRENWKRVHGLLKSRGRTGTEYQTLSNENIVVQYGTVARTANSVTVTAQSISINPT